MASTTRSNTQTFVPHVSLDDDSVQVRSITKRGNTWYMKIAKRGDHFSREYYLGTTTGKGATRGSILGSVYHVEWERE